MNGKVFIDTNILAYAMDGANPAKRDRSRELLRRIEADYSGVVSTQVAQELYITAVRKLGCDALTVKEVVHSLNRFEVVSVTMEMILDAVDCSILHRLSFWDALIVAAASAARCAELWSEDFHAGQVIRGLRIINPLR